MVHKGKHIRVEQELVCPPLLIRHGLQHDIHLACELHAIRVKPARFNYGAPDARALIPLRAGVLYGRLGLIIAVTCVLTNGYGELTTCDEHAHVYTTC